jgi:prolyl-tRNA editing enzyme YbaK/EbsC (Cys-tRNA(Pro) deacylase)
MKTVILRPEDLESFLQSRAIPGRILRLEVPTPTVEAAARAVDTQPDQIVKSILFLVAGRPVVAIACGPAHIDQRAIAAVYGVGRKQVRLANAEQVQFITGYPVGGLPPFGHHSPLPTLIDRRVLEIHEQVYAGGGDERSLLRIQPVVLQAAAQAQVADLVATELAIPGKQVHDSQAG